MSHANQVDSPAVDDEPLTLGAIVGKDVKKKIAEAVKGPAKDKTLRWPRRILWWLLAPRVNAKVDELLDLPVADSLGGAYTTLGEVREYASAYRATPPGEPFELGIKHRITLRREHKLEVRVDPWAIGSVEFDIKLHLTLQKAKMSIRNGELVSLNPGVVGAKGTFKFRVTAKEGEATGYWYTIPLPPDGKKLQLDINHPIPITPIRILPAPMVPEPEPEPVSTVEWRGPERRNPGVRRTHFRRAAYRSVQRERRKHERRTAPLPRRVSERSDTRSRSP